MKTLIAVCSLGAALHLGSQYEKHRVARAAAESRQAETTDTPAGANARLDKNAQGARGPTPKANWLEERNRNWQSPLSRGAYDRHRAVTVAPAPVIIVAPPVDRPPMGFTKSPAPPAPFGTRPPPGQPEVRRPLPPQIPIVRTPPGGPPLPRPQAPPPLPAPSN